MSESPILSNKKDIEDLSDRELLERVAAMDSEAYPIATKARKALERLEDLDEIQSD